MCVRGPRDDGETEARARPLARPGDDRRTRRAARRRLARGHAAAQLHALVSPVSPLIRRALDSSCSASGAVVQQLSGMAAAMPTRVATFAIGALLLASQAAGLDNGLGLTPVRAHMYRS